jgi:L-ribulokinase
VLDSIVPGSWGLEAGQSALGDIFGWFVREFTAPAGIGHEELSRQAEALRPGGSGLLALDWNNGNRSILANPRLTGLLLGQTLQTRPFEVYRALLEATAVGARTIIEQIRASGVSIDEIVLCGGIAEKNPLLLQIYADVLGMPLKLSAAEQTCALGAAIFGAVVAGAEGGGYDTVEEAQLAMTAVKDQSYEPVEDHQRVYDELYGLYRRLHDAFGTRVEADLGDVMKNLSQIREQAV